MKFVAPSLIFFNKINNNSNAFFRKRYFYRYPKAHYNNFKNILPIKINMM